MQPHEERVATELGELNEKRDKLGEFLKGDLFKSLSNAEQNRLTRQKDVMDQYAFILAERIYNFPK